MPEEEFESIILLKRMVRELSEPGYHFYDAGQPFDDDEFDTLESGYLEGLEG